MSLKPLTKNIDYYDSSENKVSKVPEFNADFSIPVVVETKELIWPVALTAGIRQKCFERVERNISRLTTLAQFPIGLTLQKFGHKGGVEFFVLAGVFSDTDGDYGAGYYVRNPMGTYNKSFTNDGCTVLIKLGQFHPFDHKRVVINTRNSEVNWQAVGEPGVSRLHLHKFSEEKVSLYRIRSECWLTFNYKTHGLEVFVCEGSIIIKNNQYATGNWLRYPSGSRVRITAIGDVHLYVKKSIFPK